MTEKKSNSPNIRINKVYTRSGDKGKTRLIGGIECHKDDARIEAYGTVDELNSHIGLCREMLINEHNDVFNSLIFFLKSVQNELFDLGIQLASYDNEKSSTLPKLKNDSIKKIEIQIDELNCDLPDLSSFVLSGGSQINAQFHIARNVCRRAERRVITLHKSHTIDSINLQYLNRLSDALFVWSRWISMILGDDESLWEPNL